MIRLATKTLLGATFLSALAAGQTSNTEEMVVPSTEETFVRTIPIPLDECLNEAGKATVKFPVQTGMEMAIVDVPAGTWDVTVTMEALVDLDMVLRDGTVDIVKYGGGLFNGIDTSENSIFYEGVEITYSGWNGGVNGLSGNEFIRIEGEVPGNFSFAVEGYQSTEGEDAVFTYSWGTNRSPCCTGFGRCSDDYSEEIGLGQRVEIARIPAGHADIVIDMSDRNGVDLDLELVDATNNKKIFGQGGVLGTNRRDIAVYEGTEVSYTGWNGSEERITMKQASPVDLIVQVHGYQAGTADVTITYRNRNSISPTSVSWRRKQNMELANTLMYTDVPKDVIIFRRGNVLRFSVNGATELEANMTVAVTDSWGDNIEGFEDNIDIRFFGQTMAVSMTFPVNASIGTHVVTVTDQTTQLSAKKRVIILANPGNRRDVFYMSRQFQKEYAFGEYGLTWAGSRRSRGAKRFEYGWSQYRTLDIVLRRLEKGLSHEQRANMEYVTRHVSYIVGSDICWGKWSGNYTSSDEAPNYPCTEETPCHHPGHWDGAPQLLDMHVKTGHPVQYCQCWVFSGMTTAFSRALGMPARSITNFQSAHDYDKDRTIENFFVYNKTTGSLEFQGKDDYKPSSDSVWNFHVWNEVWFKRSDINCTKVELTNPNPNPEPVEGCADGWQAIDGTPQEVSRGGGFAPFSDVYRMGPASVKLARRNLGGKDFGYDTEFLISEVNAEQIDWIKDEPEWEGRGWRLSRRYATKYRRRRIAESTIGIETVTKRIGEISRECLVWNECQQDKNIVTNEYKLPEPSGAGVCNKGANATDYEACYSSWACLDCVPGNENPIVDKDETEAVGRRSLYLQPQVEATEFQVLPFPTEPLVVTADSNAADMVVTAEYTNVGQESADVVCKLFAQVQDYRGIAFTEDAIIKEEVQRSTVAPGESHHCTFKVVKADYARFFSDYDDIEATPYAVHAITTITTGGHIVLVDEHEKIFCVPSEVLDGQCQGLRGEFRTDAILYEEGGVLDHLTKCTAPKGSTIGDGICDRKFNNEENCYDGGDCCHVSCLLQFGYDVDNKCFESTACADPAFYDKTDIDEIVDDIQPLDHRAEEDQEDHCEELVADYVEAVTTECTDSNRAACSAELLCETHRFAALDADCVGDFADDIPKDAARRCGAKTVNQCQCKMTWSYNGETFTNGACANPKLVDGSGFWSASWCEILPGSCVIHSDELYEANGNKRTWDNCVGHNTADTVTGQHIDLNQMGLPFMSGQIAVEEDEPMVSPYAEQEIGRRELVDFDDKEDESDLADNTAIFAYTEGLGDGPEGSASGLAVGSMTMMVAAAAAL